jgi:hypothetical protein
VRVKRYRLQKNEQFKSQILPIVGFAFRMSRILYRIAFRSQHFFARKEKKSNLIYENDAELHCNFILN